MPTINQDPFPPLVEMINAQTGTSYTIQASDQGKLVTFSNASSVAVTLPQATGSSGFGTFAAGWFADVRNLGAGTVTITPTTSTLNGGSSLTLLPNHGVRIVNDGANYQTIGLDAIAEADLPVPSFTSLTDSSAVTWNTNNLRMSNAVLTMAHGTSTRSLTLSNLTAGASGTLVVKQDSTGGAALTFGASPASKVINGGGGAVTVTPAANAIDVLCWTYDGTNILWNYGPNYT